MTLKALTKDAYGVDGEPPFDDLLASWSFLHS